MMERMKSTQPETRVGGGVGTDPKAEREKEQQLQQQKEDEDATCGICLESVNVHQSNSFTATTRRKKIGLLSCCNHIFCYGCLMEWRTKGLGSNRNHDPDARSTRRVCPTCRKSSDYAVPSFTLPRSQADKERILLNYKKNCAAKPCNRYRGRRNTCPFGRDCFYAHLNQRGEDVKSQDRSKDELFEERERRQRNRRRQIDLDVISEMLMMMALQRQMNGGGGGGERGGPRQRRRGGERRRGQAEEVDDDDDGIDIESMIMGFLSMMAENDGPNDSMRGGMPFPFGDMLVEMAFGDGGPFGRGGEDGPDDDDDDELLDEMPPLEDVDEEEQDSDSMPPLEDMDGDDSFPSLGETE